MKLDRLEQLIGLVPQMSVSDIILTLESIREELDGLGPQLSDDFAELKRFLESEKWPPAIPPRYICNTASKGEKYERASDILKFMVTAPLTNTKFLDYGCGEGHVAHVAASMAKYAVGYDIVTPAQQDFAWDQKKDNTLLTTSWSKASQDAPFDIILLYDVLDHCDDPVDVLKKVRSVSNEETIIYVRCHPWVGRHGGHMYDQINKAFVHLIFTEKELKHMGYEVPNTQRVYMPHPVYQEWCGEAGFSRANFVTEEKPPEQFLRNNRFVRARITKLFDFPKWPVGQLRQNFVDFVLKM